MNAIKKEKKKRLRLLKKLKRIFTKKQAVHPLLVMQVDSNENPSNRYGLESSYSSASCSVSKQSKEEGALLTWISTFTEYIEGVEPKTNIKDWTRCEKFLSNLLKIAQEICDNKLSTSSSIPGDEDTANKIYANVIELAGNNVSLGYSSKDRFISTLSSLLCFAVSEQCNNRSIYINRIMNLDKTVQVMLMKIIQPTTQTRKCTNEVTTNSQYQNEDYQSKSRRNTYLDDIDDDDDDDDSLLLDDSFEEDAITMDIDKENVPINSVEGNSKTSNLHHKKENQHIGLSPRRLPLTQRENNSYYYQRSPMSSYQKGPRKSFGSPFLHRINPSNLEREIEELRKKHVELVNELSLSRQRESDLSETLEKNNSKHLAERLKLESDSLRRESKLREQIETDKRSLEGELKQLQVKFSESEDIKEQMVSLQDEIDVLKHASEKLQLTEEQLRKHKIKLGDLSDAKEALAREEEAHSVAISKCLSLENELSALQPLRRQLEEYKTRTVQAEVKLAESESNLCQLKKVNETLTISNRDLERGAQLRQEENEGMRKKLLQDNEESIHGGSGVGDGISELNPTIKQELLHLRNENTRLKAFAEKRGDDAVQRMEEKLDDTDRLANQFKEKYFVTKRTLEETIDSKEKLEEDLISTKSKLETTQELLKTTEENLNDTKADLSSTREILVKTQESENCLKKNLTFTEQALSSTKDELSDTQQKLLTSQDTLKKTEQVLSETKKSLYDSSERESKLKEDLITTEVNLDETINALKSNEKQLVDTRNDLISTKESLHSTKIALEESRENENCLVKNIKETRTELSSTREDLKKKSEELRNTENSLSTCQENLSKTIQERDEKNKELNVAKESLEATELSLQVTNKSLEETKNSLQTSLEREASNVRELEVTKKELIQISTNLHGKSQELEKTTKKMKDLEGKLETTEKLTVQLKNSMKEERLLSQKAAIEAERKLQAAKRSLTDDARSELDVFEKKKKFELDEERKMFKERLERLTLDMNNSEAKSAAIISDLRQDFSAKMRESREQHQNTIQKIEEDRNSKLNSFIQESSIERENLVEKGKHMIKDLKLDFKKKLREAVETYEEKLSEKDEEMSKFLDDQVTYENKAKTLLSNYKRKINVIQEQQNDTLMKYDKLHDAMKKVERENITLKGDHDRMKKQLVGRYGTGSNASNELSTLHKEFKILLEENSRLKQKQSSDNNFSSYLDSSSSHSQISDAVNDMSLSQSYAGDHSETSATNSSTMAVLRAEYEETIEKLNDEKRQLIMRSSAAASDAQRSEQKVWELEAKIEKQNSEITTLKLNLKRTERHVTEPDIRPNKRHSSEKIKYNPINDGKHSNAKKDFVSNSSFTEKNKSSVSNALPHKNIGDHHSKLLPVQCSSVDNKIEKNIVSNDDISNHLKLNSNGEETMRTSLNSSSSSGSQSSQKRKASLIESTMPTNSSSKEGKQECTQS